MSHPHPLWVHRENANSRGEARLCSSLSVEMKTTSSRMLAPLASGALTTVAASSPAAAAGASRPSASGRHRYGPDRVGTRQRAHPATVHGARDHILQPIHARLPATDDPRRRCAPRLARLPALVPRQHSRTTERTHRMDPRHQRHPHTRRSPAPDPPRRTPLRVRATGPRCPLRAGGDRGAGDADTRSASSTSKRNTYRPQTPYSAPTPSRQAATQASQTGPAAGSSAYTEQTPPN